MSNFNYTKSQKEAIENRGKNIIVSAQAGAGKTQVLVDRIVRIVIDQKIPIENLLVVTFTNKAASEMKDRIKKMFLEEIRTNVKDRLFIQKQYNNISNSQISTMHSFCIDMIRNFFFKLGIDPKFKILNDSILNVTKYEVLENIFDRYYIEKDESILKFLSDYGGRFDDFKVKEMILKIFTFIKSQIYPIKWLDENISKYYKKSEVEETIVADSIEEKISKNIIEKIEKVNNYILENKNSVMLKSDYSSIFLKYREIIEKESFMIQNLYFSILENKNLNFILEKINSISFERLPAISKKKLEECGNQKCDEYKEYIKEYIDFYREEIKNIKKEEYNISDMIEEVYFMRENLEIIKKIILDFQKLFELKKQLKNGIDFSDVEHYAIKLLEDEEVVEYYKNKFSYIFFDEYQDANQIQNYIVEKIKRIDNLFFVGDIKQSIYKFRLSNPKIFYERYNQYKNSKNQLNKSIDLNENFRTRKEILEFNNFIFDSLMTEKMGQVNYKNKEHQFVPGAKFEPKKDSVNLHIIIHNKKNEEELNTEYKRLYLENPECFYIAKRIQKDIENGRTPKDIAILVRNKKYVQQMVENLEILKIPFYTDSIQFDFENMEIKLFIEMLKAVDSIKDDINLISALKSPLGNFDENDLSQIRNIDKNSSFNYSFYSYEEFEIEEKLKNKCKNFIDNIQRFSKIEKYMSLSDFIQYFLIESGYSSYILSQNNGKKKIETINAFIKLVEDFEQNYDSGLYNFLLYVDSLIKNNKSQIEPGVELSEEDDVVRIMTMHKSKGLQFKKVYLLGLSGKFNKNDSKNSYILNDSEGIALKLFNEKLNKLDTNIFFDSINRQNINDLYSEEVRILYVAMTRAIDEMDIVGIVKEYPFSKSTPFNKEYSLYDNFFSWILRTIFSDKIHEKIGMMADVIPSEITDYFSGVNNFIKFFVKDSLKLVEEKYDIISEQKNEKIQNFIPEKDEIIENIIKAEYQNIKLTHTPYKKTVSELSKKNDNKSSDFKNFQNILFNKNKTKLKIPRFLSQNKINAMEMGTLIHYLLSIIDYRRFTSGELKDKLNQLFLENYITEEEKDNVDINLLLNFFNSSLCERIIKSGHYYKEKSFSMWHEEDGVDILVDGQVDLFFIENDKLVIVDFKTDSTIDENRYIKQLEFYENGISKALNKEVKEKIIYWIKFNQITSYKL